MKQATSEQEIFCWHEVEKLVNAAIEKLRLDNNGIGSKRMMPYQPYYPAMKHTVERDMAGRTIRCTLETKANDQSDFVVESDEENRLWLSDGREYLTVEQTADYIMRPFLS